MKRTDLLPSILLTGVALGTAWAVRGQFGHEHGAAWAGAIGCMTVILLSNRRDWFTRVFPATFAGAAGWGLGGIMSYGIVVGYGKSTDFLNVYYGLAMLFVIGGLYGFMGGGLFGIALSPYRKGSFPWHKLLVEMFAGACIVYFFLIGQFGWLMTPPRSEMWAACAGIAAAITWFMIRRKMYAALRLAVITGFGAGFGFAFGNFLQVLGGVSEINFNFWNVMEYAIGFFGGTAMAYATFTADWGEKEAPASRFHGLFPLGMLSLVIPFIMWQQNTGGSALEKRLKTFPDGSIVPLTVYIQWLPYILFLALGGYWLRRLYNKQREAPGFALNLPEIRNFYLLFFGLYIFLSILITGAFMSTYRIEQYLYPVNFAVVLYFIGRLRPAFVPEAVDWKKYGMNFGWFLLFLALLAVIASNSHSEDLFGAHRRFE